MDRRSFLRLGTKILVLAGLLALILALLQSLLPSGEDDSLLPRFDISSLGPGEVTHFDGPANTPLSRRWIVLRLENGEVEVFSVPVRGGSVLLPDLHWWKPGYACRRFGPDMVQGRIAADAIIRCHDDDLPPRIAAESRWALDGENLGEMTDDIPTPRFRVEGGQLVIGRGG